MYFCWFRLEANCIGSSGVLPQRGKTRQDITYVFLTLFCGDKLHFINGMGDRVWNLGVCWVFNKINHLLLDSEIQFFEQI